MGKLNKKTSKLEQFYQHYKSKKYRNCGTQVNRDKHYQSGSKLTRDKSARDVQSQISLQLEEINQEGESYQKKLQAYQMLIDVLQSELTEKTQTIGSIKTYSQKCLGSLHHFQERCIV
jgi:hypothetical protein